jgi:hypothetical protein
LVPIEKGPAGIWTIPVRLVCNEPDGASGRALATVRVATVGLQHPLAMSPLK